MNKITQSTEAPHRTWTDTYYNLTSDDWLVSFKTIFGEGEVGKGEEGIALYCPGYSRDGNGFVIHFKVKHLDALKVLVEELEGLKAQK